MGIYFSISSLIFLFIFIIIFFSKDNSKNIETKIYSILLILTFIGTSLDILGYAFYKNDVNPYSLIYQVLVRGMLVYYISWAELFFIYAYSISEKKFIKIKNIYFVILYILFVLIACTLPLRFGTNNNTIYPLGASVNFTYFIAAVSLTFSVILAFVNIKQILVRKYTPMFLIFPMLLVLIVIQNVLPELFLINFSLTIVIVVMYFTIENPDLKIIEELKKNRSLTSKSYIEKSNFLFRMSAEVRKPIENIKELNDYNLETNNIKEIKENSKEIDLNLRDASFTLNNVLDVSGLDSNNITIIKDKKYNVKKLLNEIKIRESKKTSVRFNFNISDSLPEYLYGDAVRLKQVLMTIIDKSIERTTKGFIEINVDCIIKYDVCRLIISLEDSSTPLSLEKINDVLSLDKEITDDDLSNMILDINIVNKVINMMNGTLVIKSDMGNELVIVLDSIIADFKSEQIVNDTDILLVSNNEKLIKVLENLFKDYSINFVLNGIDAIDLIRSGENYNLIVIDDTMVPISALETLKRLHKLDINIPMVIMLDSGKEHIKHHYIKDGFVDYILKDDLKNEVKKIIDKML